MESVHVLGHNRNSWITAAQLLERKMTGVGLGIQHRGRVILGQPELAVPLVRIFCECLDLAPLCIAHVPQGGRSRAVRCNAARPTQPRARHKHHAPAGFYLPRQRLHIRSALAIHQTSNVTQTSRKRETAVVVIMPASVCLSVSVYVCMRERERERERARERERESPVDFFQVPTYQIEAFFCR